MPVGADGGDFGLPGKHSLARQMIDDWLAEELPQPWAGDVLDTVRIDAGVFKYVLARVSGDGRSKLVVWGHTAAGYHNDVLLKVCHIDPALAGTFGWTCSAASGIVLKRNHLRRTADTRASKGGGLWGGGPWRWSH